MVVTERILTDGRVVRAVGIIKEHTPPTGALFEKVGARTNELETKKIWLRCCRVARCALSAKLVFAGTYFICPSRARRWPSGWR